MFGWWKTFEAAPLPAANGLAPSPLWKDADPDIPILKEAKAEYAELTASSDRSAFPSVSRSIKGAEFTARQR
jgi:hypothetical protein